MKKTFNEQDLVRLRPTLNRQFSIGKIIDSILPGDNVQVWWIFPYSDQMEILPRLDVMLIPPDEALLIHYVIKDLKSALENPKFKKAFDIALERWLDLRRDGLDAQLSDLVNDIVAAKFLLQGGNPSALKSFYDSPYDNKMGIAS